MALHSQTLQEVGNAVGSALGDDRFDDALRIIEKFVIALLDDPATTGILFSSPELDHHCARIGAQFREQYPSDSSSPAPAGLQVYIATELYLTGGHTAVIEDIIRAQPDRTHRILVTDLNGNTDRAGVAKRFAGLAVEIRWAPAEDRAAAMAWVAKELDHCAGARVFLFNHHFDSAAIAASAGAAKSTDLHYCHHADHHLALGVHLEGATHIDLSPFSFHHCCSDLGIAGNVYLPLTAEIPEGDHTPKPDFSTPLRTACCGSPGKFSAPYAYNYFDLIPKILATTGGTHFHIGGIDAATLAGLQEGLTAHGIPAERFVHIPYTPSLWKTLQEHGITLYLSSFPITGYKAAIEVMGAGIPLLVHDHYALEQVTCRDIVYPGALYWRTPESLCETLSSLTPELLEKHADLSRAHFLAVNDPRHLAPALAAPTLAGHTPVPPPRIPHSPDPLLTFLDQRTCRALLVESETAALTGKLRKAEKTLASTRKKLETAREKNTIARTRLTAISTSLSWRITKPLRSLQKRFASKKKP